MKNNIMSPMHPHPANRSRHCRPDTGLPSRTLLLLASLIVLGWRTSLAHAESPLPDEFNPGANNTVYSVVVEKDGKILVGGGFDILGGLLRNYIARLNADGSVDSGFNPGANGAVRSLALQTDGKILVGGLFTKLGGQWRSHIGRLNADGTIDNGYTPGANAGVDSLTVQADGKILVVGDFTMLAGQPRNFIGRLNADGALDDGFNPGVSSTVYSLALQTDGRILVGGSFTNIGGQPRNRIARLNTDGTLDNSFNPGVSAGPFPYRIYPSVYSLAVQADGKILVGGEFTVLGGQPRNFIGRLHADGTVDSGFNPDAGRTDGDVAAVVSLAAQTDGKILLGGYFNTLAGQTRKCVGRLNADGTLDSGFNSSVGRLDPLDPSVNLLALQADGKILVGGFFDKLGNQKRSRIGRLNNTESATQSLSYADSTITWLRGGASPEVWRTTFDYSGDGIHWTDLGAGERISGGWRLNNITIQTAATIRAHGYVAGSGNAQGFAEATLMVAPQPLPMILTGDGTLGVRSNQFGFNINGASGQTFVVESSTNLSQWIPLRTNILGTNPFYFYDPDWSLLSHRFYRARPMR